jgi:hypothetical protein
VRTRDQPLDLNPTMPSPGVAQLGGGSPSSSHRNDSDKPTARNDNTYNAIQIITAWLFIANAPGEVKDAWKRVQTAATTSERKDASDTREAIQGLQKDMNFVKGLLEKQQAPQGIKPMSYVEAARLHHGTSVGSGPGVVREVMVPARHQREVVVAPGGKTADQKRRNGQELVEAIRKEGAEQVIAARRLPSGDVLVTTTSQDARKGVQKDTAWLKAFGEGARVKHRSYTVLAHGVRVAHFDMQKQKEAIEAIYSQNPELRGLAEIKALHWSKRTLKARKPFAPLLIDVAEPEQGNHLVDAGLIWDYQLHDCEPFTGNCKVTQCFKCFKYGHVTCTCSNIAKCGFCAALGHETNNCIQRNTPNNHRCVVCASPEAKHSAWSGACPTRKKKVMEARLAYSQRPARFQVPRTTRTTNANHHRASPPLSASTPAITPVIPQKEVEELCTTLATIPIEGITAPGSKVGEKRTVQGLYSSDEEEPVLRRRGRPRWNASALAGSKNIANMLMPPSQELEQQTAELTTIPNTQC